MDRGDRKTSRIDGFAHRTPPQRARPEGDLETGRRQGSGLGAEESAIPATVIHELCRKTGRAGFDVRLSDSEIETSAHAVVDRIRDLLRGRIRLSQPEP